jgi:acetyl esterase/lipase
MSGVPHTPLFVAVMALVALRPPMPRRSSPFNLQFALGWLVNEQPFWGLWWLLLGSAALLTQPELDSPAWWVVAGVAALDLAVLVRIAVRARSARPALAAALECAFGAGAAPLATRPSWWRIALVPFVSWRPDVRRIRNRHYGRARRGNRLDVYIGRRRRPSAAPVLVYVHGGGFRMGSKLLGARPLLHRLSAQGWVCISMDYRLSRVGYGDQLDDVRAALAWVRANAGSFGGCPRTIFLAGSSSGAHLAATAALSGSRSDAQPESSGGRTDTGIRGVVAFYGYYGDAGGPGSRSTSPQAYASPAAPPFLIVHGALDTLVLREDARKFAGQLRAVSRHPVAYAELPGAQHNFDFFHSLRFHAVTDAVVRFAELTTETRAQAERP